MVKFLTHYKDFYDSLEDFTTTSLYLVVGVLTYVLHMRVFRYSLKF